MTSSDMQSIINLKKLYISKKNKNNDFCKKIF